jgi:signal transduction histidine kinase
MPTLLRLWSRIWPLAAAGLIGATIWFVSLALALDGVLDGAAPPRFGLVLVDLLIGAISMVLVVFRHRSPLLVAVLIAAGSGLSGAATGACLLAMVSLATHRRFGQIAIAVATVAGSAVAAEVLLGLSGLSDPSWVGAVSVLVAALAVSGIAVATGVAIGSRRAELAGLQREAELLREEQQTTIERAQLAERGRIARELHDELGHRLSVIALHSAALEYRPDLAPDQRASSVAAIRSAAQQALVDLRRTLGMLSEMPSDEPSPALTERLGELVEQVRQAGSTVTVQADPSVFEGLTPELSRTVFRVVQECLTNALRHAPGVSVNVEIDQTADWLRVAVSNRLAGVEPTSPGSGIGLAGIAERVRLNGGQLQIDQNLDGHFVVEVKLPWRR